MDLRFTREEAARYLKSVMGLDLSADDAQQRRGTNRGWSRPSNWLDLDEGRAGCAGVCRRVRRNRSYVVDDLVDEVLARQLVGYSRVPAAHVSSRPPNGIALRRAHRPTRLAPVLEFLDPREPRQRFVDRQRRGIVYHVLFADLLCVYFLDRKPNVALSLMAGASCGTKAYGAQSEQSAMFAVHDLGTRLTLSRGRSRDATATSKATFRQRLHLLPDDVARA